DAGQGGVVLVEGNEHPTAAALDPVEGLVVMLDEVAEERLQERAEASPLRGVAGERLPVGEPEEERLGEILGVLVRLGPGDPEVVVDGFPVVPRELVEARLTDLGRAV